MSTSFVAPFSPIILERRQKSQKLGNSHQNNLDWLSSTTAKRKILYFWFWWWTVPLKHENQPAETTYIHINILLHWLCFLNYLWLTNICYTLHSFGACFCQSDLHFSLFWKFFPIGPTMVRDVQYARLQDFQDGFVFQIWDAFQHLNVSCQWNNQFKVSASWFVWNI